jgi:hypothetical protein
MQIASTCVSAGSTCRRTKYFFHVAILAPAQRLVDSHFARGPAAAEPDNRYNQTALLNDGAGSQPIADWTTQDDRPEIRRHAGRRRRTGARGDSEGRNVASGAGFDELTNESHGPSTCVVHAVERHSECATPRQRRDARSLPKRTTSGGGDGDGGFDAADGHGVRMPM